MYGLCCTVGCLTFHEALPLKPETVEHAGAALRHCVATGERSDPPLIADTCAREEQAMISLSFPSERSVLLLPAKLRRLDLQDNLLCDSSHGRGGKGFVGIAPEAEVPQQDLCPSLFSHLKQIRLTGFNSTTSAQTPWRQIFLPLRLHLECLHFTSNPERTSPMPLLQEERAADTVDTSLEFPCLKSLTLSLECPDSLAGLPMLRELHLIANLTSALIDFIQVASHVACGHLTAVTVAWPPLGSFRASSHNTRMLTAPLFSALAALPALKKLNLEHALPPDDRPHWGQETRIAVSRLHVRELRCLFADPMTSSLEGTEFIPCGMALAVKEILQLCHSNVCLSFVGLGAWHKLSSIVTLVDDLQAQHGPQRVAECLPDWPLRCT
jgi:hypothetical protein